VQIDRPDQADEPGDTHVHRYDRLARDNPNTASSGDGSANSPRVGSDARLRAERSAANRAAVDAVYRKDAIDPSHARMEKLGPEKISPAMRRIVAGDHEIHGAARADRLQSKGRFAEPADLKKREVPQAPDEGIPAATIGGSVPAERNGWIRDRAIQVDWGGKHRSVPGTSTLVHGYDLPQVYTSSPALTRDPYHPDSVAGRSTANRELYAATSRDQAASLGYTKRIPAQKVFSTRMAKMHSRMARLTSPPTLTATTSPAGGRCSAGEAIASGPMISN
jgi:hypothetical protein